MFQKVASDFLDNDEVGVEMKGQVVKVKSWLNAKGKLTLGKGAENLVVVANRPANKIGIADRRRPFWVVMNQQA